MRRMMEKDSNEISEQKVEQLEILPSLQLQSVLASEIETLAWLRSALSITTSRGRPASDNTLDAYSSSVSRLLRSSGKRFEEITAEDFQTYIRFRATQVSHNSVVADDRNLRAVFALANKRNNGRFDFLPASPRLRADKPNKQKLSELQSQRLLALAEEKFTYREQMILRTLLMAGLRVSELVEAKREDYHHGSLHLTRTKGSKPRIVYLPKKLQDQIRDWLKVQYGQFLFGNLSGTKGNRRSVHRLVRKAGRLVAVYGLHPHALRRTYGSVAHSKGAPLKFIQQQFGHANIKTTMEYIDIDAETSRKLANEYCEL